MFTNSEIAEYYDTTRIHYNRWWKLRKSLSLHYGIWDESVRNFSGSLNNTNRVMMEICGISEGDKVLDAGYGVGGAAVFLQRMKNAEVTGISLSEKQIQVAREYALKNKLVGKVFYKVMDFTRTDFKNETFDVVWACESVCQAQDKEAFIRESFRLLKKGGKLIMCDYFLPEENQYDKNSWIRKWCDSWAISELITLDVFKACLAASGFKDI